MKILESLFSNKLKLQLRHFLYNLLSLEYSKYGVPIEITKILPCDKPITFIDIGASTGSFSKNLCKQYPVAKALLIEPLSNLIPILKSSFPDIKKFKIINCAISDENSKRIFFYNEDQSHVSSLLDIYYNELPSLKLKPSKEIKIQTRTLDSLVQAENLEAIDLIKIDVQGAEHLVLNSATETLKRTRLIYTEFSFRALYRDSSTFHHLYNILSANNFMLIEITKGYKSPTGELLQGDALFMNKNLISSL